MARKTCVDSTVSGAIRYLLIAGMAFVTPAQADQAVVVGINQYPHFKGATLSGCVNDAAKMQGVLKQHGFVVAQLVDKQATKKGLLSALDKVKNSIKSDERFVFYFAGHGTRHDSGRGALMLHDSNKDEATDLTADQLFEIFKGIKVKARAVTILLDSCYSGAMARAWDDKSGRRARFFRRPEPTMRAADAGRLTPVLKQEKASQGQTNQWDSGGKAGLCYFTASSGKEVAEEHNTLAPDGKPSGVFTHFLSEELRKMQKPVAWAPLQMSVAGQVAKFTENLQHPTLSALFRDVPVFEAPGAKIENAPNGQASQSPATVSLWELYQSQQQDAGKLKLWVRPDVIPMPVGEKFQLGAQVGEAGYLLIIERAISGKVNLWFPMSGQLDEAKVQAGQEITIPPNPKRRLINDRPGMEYVKALLFADNAAGQKLAAALLERFRADETSPHAPRLFQPGRDWVEVNNYDWVSADIALRVVEPGQKVVPASQP